MSQRSGASRFAGALTFLLLALHASSCGGSGAHPVAPPRQDGAAQRGGRLVVGSPVDVDAWNEYVSQQSFASNLLRRCPGCGDLPQPRPLRPDQHPVCDLSEYEWGQRPEVPRRVEESYEPADRVQ